MSLNDRGDLEKLHKVQLDLARIFVSVCEKHNLSYFLIEGSLLGAVRHKGFIPWDDDIDFGMPRDDYECLLREIRHALGENYQLVTYHSERKALRYFSQLECTDIKLRVSAQKDSSLRNAWIDIFPLDGMPDNPIIRRWHLFKILILRAAIQFSQFDEIVNVNRKNRPLHEKILIKIGQKTKLGHRWDTRKLMKKLDALLKKYNYYTCNYCINSMSAYKSKAVFPREYFGKGILYEFEGMLLKGPEQYDLILKQIYGDYMTPPPENERNVHFSEIV